MTQKTKNTAVIFILLLMMCVIGIIVLLFRINQPTDCNHKCCCSEKQVASVNESLEEQYDFYRLKKEREERLRFKDQKYRGMMAQQTDETNKDLREFIESNQGDIKFIPR